MVFDLAVITKVAIRTIREIQTQILRQVAQDPASTLESAVVGERGKRMLTVDLVAERNCADKLRQGLTNYDLLVLGEESLGDQGNNLRGKDQLVVLMDMVDGTDLLERSLGNWCSAMVFYYPPQERVLAAFVALPGECIYFATETHARPFKYVYHAPDPKTPNPLPNNVDAASAAQHLPQHKVSNVSGPSDVKDLESASIAFYGQQVSHLDPIVQASSLFRRLHSKDKKLRLKKPPTRLQTRIYNLAGNPMMMRLIDGHKKIDAVFEVHGQAPHDVIPGAYIAKKAGAIFTDLEGQEIPLHELLLTPAKSKVRYVLASTPGLSHELRSCLSTSKKKRA